VVRRLSSKEEKRRVIPSVVDPTRLPQTNRVGIENHLNVFHSAKKPLTREVAFGLASFLAHPSVDFFIREFNGHTQVNAGDLRRLKFPSIQDLTRVGQRAMTQPWLDDAASLWENDCT
jgi:adenine-specific DNA-methyltransferase